MVSTSSCTSLDIGPVPPLIHIRHASLTLRDVPPRCESQVHLRNINHASYQYPTLNYQIYRVPLIPAFPACLWALSRISTVPAYRLRRTNVEPSSSRKDQGRLHSNTSTSICDHESSLGQHERSRKSSPPRR